MPDPRADRILDGTNHEDFPTGEAGDFLLPPHVWLNSPWYEVSRPSRSIANVRAAGVTLRFVLALAGVSLAIALTLLALAHAVGPAENPPPLESEVVR